MGSITLYHTDDALTVVGKEVLRVDETGRLVAVDRTTLTPPQHVAHRETFAYDADGHLVEAIGRDSLGRFDMIRRLQYDTAGRWLGSSVIGAGGLHQIIEVEWESPTRLFARVGSKRSVLDMDEAGRLVEFREEPPNSRGAPVHISYRYEGVRVVEQTITYGSESPVASQRVRFERWGDERVFRVLYYLQAEGGDGTGPPTHCVTVEYDGDIAEFEFDLGLWLSGLPLGFPPF